MLTGVQIAFIGEDARQLEIIKHCIEQDATLRIEWVLTILDSEFSGTCKGDLTPEIRQTLDVLVLPIVGTDENGYVESIFTSKKIQLTNDGCCRSLKRAPFTPVWQNLTCTISVNVAGSSL